ncbi:MAG: glycosyltransferase, partial [Cellulosilyticaceae bacterium]
MNPKISIIVPVYKVEQYLHKCIDSILAQTFTNFELILVDDGSPDQCGEICEEYARKDDRIVVIHKENGGLSSARNAGLDRAKGDYIGFVDSDDYIESDMYEILYNSCVKYQCEIANCSSIIYFPHKTVSNGEHQILIHTKEEAMKNMLLSKFYDEVVWVKLFKKDVIGDIRFPEGRIYEDTAFTYKVIDRCEKYCFVGEAKYHYIKREGSVMSSANKVVRLDALWA